MPEAADILERIDRCIRELEAIKAEVVASMPVPAAEGEILATVDDDEADFQPHLMLWPSEAAQRFNFAVDTVRYLCRVEGHRPAEQRDELAPFQLIELHSAPCQQGRIVGCRIGEDQFMS